MPNPPLHRIAARLRFRENLKGRGLGRQTVTGGVRRCYAQIVFATNQDSEKQ
jgi:hypothetical protein